MRFVIADYGIADFVASRYGRSTLLGGPVTVIAAVGILPYLSLQLKAIATGYEVLRHYPLPDVPTPVVATPSVASGSANAALNRVDRPRRESVRERSEHVMTEVGRLEIGAILAEHRPFDQLPAEPLATLAAALAIRYVRRGAEVPERDDGERVLSVVRTGAVELRAGDGALLARLGEGDLLGHRASAHQGAIEGRAVAIEDTLL